MTVQNLAEYRIKAHLREHQETHRLSPARAPVVPLLTSARCIAPDDDTHLQEGAARFRAMQSDYERHTSSARQPAPQRIRTGVDWRRVWHITSSILGGILFAAAVLLYVAWTSKAMGQTPPTILVRACPTTPAATGFSACTNSTWVAPAPGLIVDAQRAGIDTWLTPDRLQAGDTVFACEDPTVAPGPFKNCPSTLPNQTNNYLAASSITFGSTPLPPAQRPTANGTLALGWVAPGADSTGSPITQPLSYQVFVRSNDCTAAGPACQPTYYGGSGLNGLRAPSADVAATSATLSLPAGPWCAIVEAYFTGFPDTLGPPPDHEWCGTIGAGLVTPGKVTGIQVRGQ